MSGLEYLPLEILQEICQELSNPDGRPTPWLVTLSSQSRKLRQAALPYLFRTIRVALNFPEEDDFASATSRRTFLDFLTDNPHLTRYVRNINVVSWHSSVIPEQASKFKALVSNSTCLRFIRVSHYQSQVLEILQEANPLCQVSVDAYPATFYRKDPSSNWTKPLRAIPNVGAISVVTFEMGDPLPDFFNSHPKLERLNLMTPQKGRPAEREDVSQEIYASIKDNTYTMPPLRALAVDGFLGLHTIGRDEEETATFTERVAFLNNIQWDALRLLSLEGGLFIQRFLTHWGDRMTALRHLSLWINDHINPYVEHQGGAEATAKFLQTSTCAQNLLSLEIRGCSSNFPMTSIKSDTLRSLKFYNYETGDRNAAPTLRPPSDLRHLAQHCPSLRRLSIDFPNMENLFHPTAIPGVDTDIAVYTFLQALSEIPKLSHLHLFPPYSRSGEEETATYVQPFTDDDLAIRLFKHIRTQQALNKASMEKKTSTNKPSTADPTRSPTPPYSSFHPSPPPPDETSSTLTNLFISSTQIFVQFISGFPAQSWHVESFPQHPSRFFMTLRQATKHYEQRQLWEGERRLRTEIRRDKWNISYGRGFSMAHGEGWHELMDGRL